AASKFMQKLWNILRFALLHLEAYEPGTAPGELRVVDTWLLTKLNKLVQSVTDAMETYKFDEAMKEIRAFTWNTLADDYIELAKSRLYGRGGDDGTESAKYALYRTLVTLSKLLAPFAPFFAEEMHLHIGNGGSVHRAPWPVLVPEELNADAEAQGDLIADIVRAVRHYKSEQGIALNAPLGTLRIYGAQVNTEDIENAMATPVELVAQAGPRETAGTVLDVRGTQVELLKE
ncbi:MAG: class I tRNA ligase family protein, partial [Methanomicrobia archaeon]|nr:class I tRNA ligase family protein [Methanomicrobia archaeon]